MLDNSLNKVGGQLFVLHIRVPLIVIVEVVNRDIYDKVSEVCGILRNPGRDIGSFRMWRERK